MAIEYETTYRDVTVNGSALERLCITYIFEHTDYRDRRSAWNHCLEKVIRFYSGHFKSAHLLVLNLQLDNNRINRHVGVWAVLEKSGIKFPQGKRSERIKVAKKTLKCFCKVEFALEYAGCVIEVMAKIRSSILILGADPKDDVLFDQVFNYVENLWELNPNTWDSFAAYLTKNHLIGIRLFGMFDDLESGLIVYEPFLFAKTYGDWNKRQRIK